MIGENMPLEVARHLARHAHERAKRDSQHLATALQQVAKEVAAWTPEQPFGLALHNLATELAMLDEQVTTMKVLAEVIRAGKDES